MAVVRYVLANLRSLHFNLSHPKNAVLFIIFEIRQNHNLGLNAATLT